MPPYLEQGSFNDTIHYQLPLTSSVNETPRKTFVRAYRCPTQPAILV
jgi:hypothetical protein